MKRKIQTQPTNLTFLPKTVIVEERRGTTRLFPHTEQLPGIARALRMQFGWDLPRKVRENPVYCAFGAFLFSHYIRDLKCEPIWPYPVLTKNGFVAIAVVQHITESTPEGLLHSFRLFQGEDFLPDVYFNGQPVKVCTHFFDRFFDRSVTGERADAIALNLLWRTPKLWVKMPNRTDAIALAGKPVRIIPYENIGGTLILKTCLTRDEITFVTAVEPLTPIYAHFGVTYNPPPNVVDIGDRVCKQLTNDIQKYERIHLQSGLDDNPRLSWGTLAGAVPSATAELIHSGPSTIGFMDGVYGPTHCFRFDHNGIHRVYMAV